MNMYFFLLWRFFSRTLKMTLIYLVSAQAPDKGVCMLSHREEINRIKITVFATALNNSLDPFCFNQIIKISNQFNNLEIYTNINLYINRKIF